MREMLLVLGGLESLSCEDGGCGVDFERLLLEPSDDAHPEDAFIAGFVALLEMDMRLTPSSRALAVTLAQAALDEVGSAGDFSRIELSSLLSCSATLGAQKQMSPRERMRLLRTFRAFLCADGDVSQRVVTITASRDQARTTCVLRSVAAA